ncbi:DUF3159 domain-containing protein [Nesterenkonia sphaerica]|uniref:DUF3159 domain-containing protein n=1 Tax=Nesterenkonia sphaerica TaxID=1804988 RepID=A0A5R9ALB6_9MICC|nr:DUF3159 domain-containing protein [Nesterenkonia sphaerica]TLP79491.1 DUF3159 domain-containing protein [Nesterenkonia sphaerica]
MTSQEPLGQQLSDSAARRLSTREDGSLDVMGSVGGWRGIIEAALPATSFLTAYLVVGDLPLAIILAIAVGVLFAVVRIAQRGSLVQSLSGLAGVLICAAFAHFSGEARGYYVPGFFINVAYIVALVTSIAVKWPLMGVVFGVIRGEGMQWRQDALRRRSYAVATWLITAVLASRLAVQLPLYFADHETALGVTRVVMGVPLYAFALWLGWMITREREPSRAQ